MIAAECARKEPRDGSLSASVGQSLRERLSGGRACKVGRMWVWI